MDVMHKSSKYQRLNQKTKTLSDQKDLAEISQFGIHRSTFEKMRARAAAMDRMKEAQGGQGYDESFNVKINSKGKLDDF